MKDRLHEEILSYPKWYYAPIIILALVATAFALNPQWNGLSDNTGLLIVALSLFVPVGLMAFMRLSFYFTDDSIIYNFTGSGKQEIFRDDIADAKVIEYNFTDAFKNYNPTRDRNYIMGGQYALRLEMTSGKVVTLTTRDARGLRKFLKAWLAAEPATEETLDLNDFRAEPLRQESGGYSSSDLV